MPIAYMKTQICERCHRKCRKWRICIGDDLDQWLWCQNCLIVMGWLADK